MRRVRRALGLALLGIVVGSGLYAVLRLDDGGGGVTTRVEACTSGPSVACDGERDAGPPLLLIAPMLFVGFLVAVGLPVLLLGFLLVKILTTRRQRS